MGSVTLGERRNAVERVQHLIEQLQLERRETKARLRETQAELVGLVSGYTDLDDVDIVAVEEGMMAFLNAAQAYQESGFTISRLRGILQG